MELDFPHRRYNPLTGEWILVSPHRGKRPWQGAVNETPPELTAEFEPSCYLCPGNTRIGGAENPTYESTYTFENDSQALLPESGEVSESDNPLFQAQSVQGTCRVICFSPKHNLSLASMPETDIECVINTWQDQLTELGKEYAWVQLFENKGEIMGCSSPHPHGQIWASKHLPNEAAKEDAKQAQYLHQHKQSLLLDYAQSEIELKDRIVVQNKHWIVVVPYWATWPFETLLLPTFKAPRLCDINAEQKTDLAKTLKTLLTTYNKLFDCEFPYSMGWHGAPFNNSPTDHWQVHAHFYPPLLRSATIKKFMVGYEMLAESQRDLTAEQAAQRLRNCQ